VCADDPRTTEQRRADACGPLARGEAMLACRCGAQDCPAAAQRNVAAAAVIHVLADQATVDGTGDEPGFGILPPESVRAQAATAMLASVSVPTDAAPDPGHRPSARTREFIRWRDLTCRWPGCDRPVQNCDVDHTVPWPRGPTHPSNTKPSAQGSSTGCVCNDRKFNQRARGRLALPRVTGCDLRRRRAETYAPIIPGTRFHVR
jgi:Domain of unknown function (DUF222)